MRFLLAIWFGLSIANCTSVSQLSNRGPAAQTGVVRYLCSIGNSTVILNVFEASGEKAKFEVLAIENGSEKTAFYPFFPENGIRLSKTPVYFDLKRDALIGKIETFSIETGKWISTENEAVIANSCSPE